MTGGLSNKRVDRIAGLAGDAYVRAKVLPNIVEGGFEDEMVEIFTGACA